jgi:hypothetical protein
MSCPKPRFASWKVYQDHKPTQTKKMVSKRHTAQVYLQQVPPIYGGERLIAFLNKNMEKHGLCEGIAVKSCNRAPTGNWWVVEPVTESVAEKLLYLNKIRCGESCIQLWHSKSYKGRLPRFLTFLEFLKHKKSLPNDAYNSSLRVSGDQREYDKDSAPSGSKEQGPRKTFVKAGERVGALTKEQADLVLAEAARLKLEFTNLAREHMNLKQEFVRTKEENEVLRVNKEMEEGFKQASGAHDQPIEFIDEPEEAKVELKVELAEAQKAAEVAKQHNADLHAELQSVTSQLTTTQEQLAAVHQSWQDQQQQLTDQQSQLGELTEALEDTETRFRNVTESLAVQTTELANERQEKRKLSQVLDEERKLHKGTKRKLQAFQSIKGESACDV